MEISEVYRPPFCYESLFVLYVHEVEDSLLLVWSLQLTVQIGNVVSREQLNEVIQCLYLAASYLYAIIDDSLNGRSE